MAKKHKKGKGMKPEVKKIFEELEDYHDYCRMNLYKYDESDLFKSKSWQKFNEGRKRKAAFEMREAKRAAKKAAQEVS